jgi:hypothetical protein
MSPRSRAFRLARLLSHRFTRDMPNAGNVAWRVDRLPTAGNSIRVLQRIAAPKQQACFPRVGGK